MSTLDKINLIMAFVAFVLILIGWYWNINYLVSRQKEHQNKGVFWLFLVLLFSVLWGLLDFVYLRLALNAIYS